MSGPSPTASVADDGTAVRLHHRVARGARESANWWQLVRFGLVGASGYVINLTAFALALKLAGLSHIPAAIVAFAVAVVNNFWWNRHWTFRATHAHAHFQAARFLTVSLAALGLNLVVLELCVSVLGLPALAGQAIAVLTATPVSFLGNRLWSFR